MIDIKLIRENKDLVKENIKKKFQDKKLPLVDEVFDLDQKTRSIKQESLKRHSPKMNHLINFIIRHSVQREDVQPSIFK